MRRPLDLNTVIVLLVRRAIAQNSHLCVRQHIASETGSRLLDSPNARREGHTVLSLNDSPERHQSKQTCLDRMGRLTLEEIKTDHLPTGGRANSSGAFCDALPDRLVDPARWRARPWSHGVANRGVKS